MKTLFIGGTGIISTACVQLAVERGHEVWVLNRGRRDAIPGTTTVAADANDLKAARGVLGSQHWDAVVDFVSFTVEDIERRLELLAERTASYIFISSASAYQRPARSYWVTESTPLDNPFWQYSRDKIACEERLWEAMRHEAFPVVVIRPSLTFGDRQIPLAMNSWQKPYTAVDRMRRGHPVIVPGDGSSLWTITHNSDFAKGLVGLLGNGAAIGHAFHITSDEVLTWDQIYLATARAAGVEKPELLHMASDFIVACLPDLEGSLIGDKMTSAVMDNTKIKRFVPGYLATTRFEEGIRRTMEWFDADARRREVDADLAATYDRLIEAYRNGLAEAKRCFGR